MREGECVLEEGKEVVKGIAKIEVAKKEKLSKQK